MAAFQWTKRREAVALLVAQDEKSDKVIALEAGISERQLDRYKRLPEFMARVDELVAAMREAIRGRGIAEKQNRVDALNDRWDRMRQVITERASDIDMEIVPGGQTGLLVKQAKLVKVYDSSGLPKVDEDGEMLYSAKRDVLVYEYAVDTGLLKELREHEKQAAQELGQWVEKQEHSGQVGNVLVMIPDNGRGDRNAN